MAGASAGWAWRDQGGSAGRPLLLALPELAGAARALAFALDLSTLAEPVFLGCVINQGGLGCVTAPPDRPCCGEEG